LLDSLLQEIIYYYKLQEVAKTDTKTATVRDRELEELSICFIVTDSCYQRKLARWLLLPPQLSPRGS